MVSINIYFDWLQGSSNKDTILFKNCSIFCNLAFNVLFCLLCQFDSIFLLDVTQLGLLLPFFLQSGSDGLVLPTNLMCQTAKQGKLQLKNKFHNGTIIKTMVYFKYTLNLKVI